MTEARTWQDDLSDLVEQHERGYHADIIEFVETIVTTREREAAEDARRLTLKECECAARSCRRLHVAGGTMTDAAGQRVEEIKNYHDEECTLRATDCCDTCLVLARLRAVEAYWAARCHEVILTRRALEEALMRIADMGHEPGASLQLMNEMWLVARNALDAAPWARRG